ncbi:MAG: alpha/beta fold hydrolase [Burkholderiales bacterium]
MLTDTARESGEAVIVVHGLWLHGWVFTRLRNRLRRRGLDAHTFSYPSMGRGFAQNVAALARFASSVKGGRVHLVGHSLGGLICLRYAAQSPDPRLSRIVLLGSPVKGSSVAAQLAKGPLGKWLLGSAWRELAHGIAARLPPHIEVGVIAGNVGLGLGRLAATIAGPHDGTVTVEETRMEGAADALLLRTTHTGLIFSARAAQQVACFLAKGKFDRSQDP